MVREAKKSRYAIQEHCIAPFAKASFWQKHIFHLLLFKPNGQSNMFSAVKKFRYICKFKQKQHLGLMLTRVKHAMCFPLVACHTRTPKERKSSCVINANKQHA